MIGSGTTITKSVSPNSDNSLTAETYGDNNIYVSNVRLPSGNLPKGNSFPIRGIIHSKYKITKVYGGVCYRYDYDLHYNNQKTDQYFEIDNPALSSNSSSYSYTYDLSGEFNKNIVFNYLSAGEYICYVCAQYYDHIAINTGIIISRFSWQY